MDKLLKKLIKELPPSNIELNEKNVNKIHRQLPVPNEYQILWADISSFGGYPSGIVLTDKALVFKAAKESVQQYNEAVKQEEKKKPRGERRQAVRTYYQIIPWDLYSPDDYSVCQVGIWPDAYYSLQASGKELARFGSSQLADLLKEYNKAPVLTEAPHSMAEIGSAGQVPLMANGAAFDAAHHAQIRRHGFYGEKISLFFNRLFLRKASYVGGDNAADGPDLLVNDQQIQCKYCKSAEDSINACFKPKGFFRRRTFRYMTADDQPMQIEVPRDQYREAVERMENEIRKGHVPGVSDPAEAKKIIRRGWVTYKQAENMAKAGTIESLTFDTAQSMVKCLSAFGVSAVIAFAQTYIQTKDPAKSARSALITGGKIYGQSVIGSVIAAQISKTGAYYAVSKTVGDKLAGSVLSSGVMIAVFVFPDFCRLMFGRLSGAQFLKNMAVITGSFAGAAAGAAAAGAIAGKAAGGALGGIAGAAVGLVGGMVGGAAARIGVKAIGDLFHEDDCIITARLFNAVLSNMAFDYLLSEEETSWLSEKLAGETKELRQLQEKLLKAENQTGMIRDYLRPKFHQIIRMRHDLPAVDQKLFESGLNTVIAEEGLLYGV